MASNVHGYPGGDSEYSSLQTKLQKRPDAAFHDVGLIYLG